MIAFPVLAAVLYNSLLAFLNAHGLHQTYGSVAVTELLILGVTAAYLFLSDGLDLTAVSLIAYGITVSAYMTFTSGTLSADTARSMLIIGLFYAIGSRMDRPTFDWTFRLTVGLVLAVLLLELASTETYAKIFAPASYYASTRGVQELSVDSSGLFRNALGFEGRFSFGLSDHRTASLFIEQVSLANFAGVLGVFLLARFDRLSGGDRLLYGATLLLILLTNNSRTSLFLSGTCIIGYFVYPLLDAAVCLLIMPSVLGVGFVLNTVLAPVVGADRPSDDLRGRVAITMEHLAAFDLASFFGGAASIAPKLLDSGYAYVIASSTVVGLCVLWLFVAFSVRAGTAAQRRCLFGLNLYFFANLMIGGTAVFSIKVAAPLWLLVGYMAVEQQRKHVVTRTAPLLRDTVRERSRSLPLGTP